MAAAPSLEALVTEVKAEATDNKGYVSDDFRSAFFRKLRALNVNRICTDCPNRNPVWISLSHGTYVCLECSGEHRRKGVHISFVRACDMDKFYPYQLIQMAIGGNGRANEYFKQCGQGKQSPSGRIDYNSKAAVRFRQTMEKEAIALCEKNDILWKAAPSPIDPSAPDPIPAPKAAGTPWGQQKDDGFGFKNVAGGGYAQPKVAAQPQVKAPMTTMEKAAAATPTTVVVRKAETSPVEPTKPVSAPAANDTSPTAATPQSKAGNFGKKMAKEIDFDFDFDEMEKEANLPPPPKPEPPQPSAPVPVQVQATKAYSAPVPAAMKTYGYSAPAPVEEKIVYVTDEFGIRVPKKVVTGDQGQKSEEESAHDRMDRDRKMREFQNSGAISSASYFGEDENSGRGGDKFENAKVVASLAASRASESARAGISKGKELLSGYLSKVSG